MDIVCDEKHRRSILYSRIKSNRHGVCSTHCVYSKKDKQMLKDQNGWVIF